MMAPVGVVDTREAMEAQRSLVAALAEVLAPQAGPHGVTRIETHISHVLVAGDTAYKIKKPLHLPFVDYSTLARRKACCDEELRLNRRLAPALYLGVAAVTGPRERPRIDGDGDALEYAVRMRSFAQEDLLSSMLERGTLAPAHVDELAQIAAAFHAQAPRAPPESPYGTPAHVLADALENFDEMLALGGMDAAVAALRAWTRTAFDACEPAIAQRRREGAVRECHGDLHLGNAALVDGRVTVFDCIEFNADLRWIDVAAEAAFATMDMADRGRDDYAWRFLNAWLEATGDYGSAAVLRFHLVYRAMVRAKVRSLRAAQLDVPDGRARVRQEAEGYVALARRLALARRAAIVVTHGVAGSGKTTLAQALLEGLPAIRLRTDVERKRLQGLAPTARSGSPVDAGLYASAITEQTYDRLAAHAGIVATAGYTAVLDGTFLRRAQRELMRTLAASLGVPFVILDVHAPDAVLRRRVEQRARGGADASEATVEVLERQLRDREPLTGDERSVAVTVDATRAPDAALVAIVAEAIDAQAQEART
jgi:aminoglycoside phosphotransferase family enzyme/predicted kinase